MAIVSVKGLESLGAMFAKLKNVPDDVLTSALNEMAAVGEKAVRSTGEAYNIRDPESSVHILDSITHSKPKLDEDGGVTYVRFAGSRTRGKKHPTKTRNTLIAFMQEYGARGRPARPFVRLAAEQYADDMAAPGEKILGDWAEKTFQG